METRFETGDHLVLSVPVVRAVENDPWSTVTFALANGQWVTMPQSAKEIVKVLKGPADALIEVGARREHVEQASVHRSTDGQTMVVLKSESGQSEFEFSGDELVRFAGKAAAEAASLTAIAGSPSFEPDSALKVTEISVDGQAGDPPSVRLAVQAGRLKLAFDMEANVLLQAVKHYLDQRRAASSAPADPQPAAAQ
jgi:hypothetical protein